VASHGLRWIDYQYMGEAAEREHIRKAVEITTQVITSEM
jgi:peptidoglycan/xylan/chitin deacetylase (PgdA/CDA1 family)